MNVTVSLPDDLINAARHAAVDRRMSLSAWMAGLIKYAVEREINFNEGEDFRIKAAHEKFLDKLKYSGNSSGHKFDRDEMYEEVMRERLKTWYQSKESS